MFGFASFGIPPAQKFRRFPHAAHPTHIHARCASRIASSLPDSRRIASGRTERMGGSFVPPRWISGPNRTGIWLLIAMAICMAQTTSGGAYNNGTVYEMVRPVPPKTAWTATVLYSFTGGADGGIPFGGLVFDNVGNLYGTTEKAVWRDVQCGGLWRRL